MTDNAPPSPLLEVRDITLSFPGVRALNSVSLTVGRAEVVSVVGENGAGKSTLMKILAGVQEPDSGEIRLDGEPVRFRSVRDAMSRGIALIHQELNLADNLTVAGNIFLGREPLRWGLIDQRQMNAESAELLARVGLRVDPRQRVRELTIAQQQMVEIAKAVSVNARVLIMDEPTSSLSAQESERLFEVIASLQQAGVSILYISHRLQEVRNLSHRVVVLRDGENAGELRDDDITHDNLVRLMVGRDISRFYSRQPHTPGAVVLTVEGLTTHAWPTHAATLEIRAGEIVGIAGLVGAGRTELLQAMFGVDDVLAGSVTAGDRQLTPRSARDAIESGLALVPEDRKHHGVVLEMSVRHNISLASLQQQARSGGLVNFAAERRQSREMRDRLRIKTPSDETLVGTLSGGNQQKVVLGKWLALRPRVLLMDEPTRGIDIGAKQEIYQLMDELAGDGIAVLFVSSELEEIIGMSDRVIVMHEGEITGELSRAELTEEAVMQLATGGRRASATGGRETTA